MGQGVTKRAVAEIPIFEYDQVTSTQDIARELIYSGAIPENQRIDGELISVITANYQRLGRGRLDRVWQAAAQTSVLATFVIARRKVAPMVDVAHLMIATALCLRECNVNVGIKWPNDLVELSEGKKLGGTLSEILDNVVLVGIGLNVKSNSYPNEFSQFATSIAESGCELNSPEIIDLIVKKFLEHPVVEPQEIWSAYRELSATLNTDVRIETVDGMIDAFAVDIDSSGALVIKTPDGEPKTISAGDIVHLRSKTSQQTIS